MASGSPLSTPVAVSATEEEDGAEILKLQRKHTHYTTTELLRHTHTMIAWSFMVLMLVTNYKSVDSTRFR